MILITAACEVAIDTANEGAMSLGLASTHRARSGIFVTGNAHHFQASL